MVKTTIKPKVNPLLIVFLAFMAAAAADIACPSHVDAASPITIRSAKVVDGRVEVEVFIQENPENWRLSVYLENPSYSTHKVALLDSTPWGIFTFSFPSVPKGTYRVSAWVDIGDKAFNSTTTLFVSSPKD